MKAEAEIGPEAEQEASVARTKTSSTTLRQKDANNVPKDHLSGWMNVNKPDQ